MSTPPDGPPAPPSPRNKRPAQLPARLNPALGLALGAAPLVMAAARAGWQARLRKALPPLDGTLAAPVAAPVRVLRDGHGIPHIYAATLSDLFIAQGYIHAQDRLWQIEFQRRMATGTLSELFGPLTLQADRLLRRFAMRQAAEAEVAQLDAEEHAALDSYCRGVNAALVGAIAGRQLPIEFAILRVEPQPYTITDAVCWIKMVAFGLAGNWESELIRARMVAHLGPERAARLEPLYHDGQPLATSPDLAYTGLDAAVTALLDEYEALASVTGLELLAGGQLPASNNWVVAPERSTTGRPILCNDPHLPLQAPCIWYLNHLVSADGMDVTGVSQPGCPGVVLGHNRHVAWGVTNAMLDVEDLYIERLHPNDPTLVEYQGQWEQARVEVAEIRVRGRRDPVREPLLFTRHGPILCADWASMGGSWLRPAPPVAPNGSNGHKPAPVHPRYAIALRWTAHEPGHTSRGMLAMNRARNWTEWTAGLREWTEPALNYVYADDGGNIGYYLGGRVPIRPAGGGQLPLPGWDGAHEWAGTVPFDELPHAFNPPAGYLLTANNRIAGPDYPYYLGTDWNNGYRARRIADVLAASNPISPAAAGALQNDIYSLPAHAIARLVVDRLGQGADDPATRPPYWDAMLAILAAWDGMMTLDSPAATICEYLLADLQGRVFGLALPNTKLLHNYLGGSTQSVMPGTTYVSRNLTLLLRLLTEADPAWFALMGATPQARQATWDGVLRAGWAATGAQLRRKLGADPARWTWGRVHNTRFLHPLGRVPGLARVFDPGPVPTPGSRDTVAASAVTISPHQPASSFGAGFRSVFSPGDWDAAGVIIVPGQSGHPASPHYSDLVDPWLAGVLIPLPYSPAAVEAATAHTLVLTPA